MTTFPTTEEFNSYVLAAIEHANIPKYIQHVQTTEDPPTWTGYLASEPAYSLVISYDGGHWKLESYPCKPELFTCEGDDLGVLLGEVKEKLLAPES